MLKKSKSKKEKRSINDVDFVEKKINKYSQISYLTIANRKIVIIHSFLGNVSSRIRISRSTQILSPYWGHSTPPSDLMAILVKN